MTRPSPRSVRARLPPESLLRQVRIPFVQRATVIYEHGTEQGFIVDLGLFGVFVERSEALPVGTSARIEFLMPGNEIPIRARCRVAWWHAPGTALVSKALPSGVGLQFVEMPRDNHARLRAHLLDYLLGNPRNRRFQPQWPDPGDGTP